MSPPSAPAQLRWIEGEYDQSCTDVCTDAGRLCDVDVMRNATSLGQMQEAAVAAGWFGDGGGRAAARGLPHGGRTILEVFWGDRM